MVSCTFKEVTKTALKHKTKYALIETLNIKLILVITTEYEAKSQHRKNAIVNCTGVQI